MSIDAIYTLDKVVLPGPVALDQIRTQSVDAGISELIHRGGAHVDPLLRTTIQQAPGCRFTTTQLETLFGTAPLFGVETGANTDFYFKQWGVVGPLARAATSHHRFRAAAGVLYVDSVELATDSDVRADCQFLPISVSGASALVPTGGVALSGTMQSGEHFTLGKTFLNGSLISGVQRITLSTGISARREYGDGEVDPTFTGIQETDPVITITIRNPALWATIGLEGSALDGVNGLVFYAQRLANNRSGGAARVSGALTSHVQFASLVGTYAVTEGSGDGTSPAEFTITVRPTATSDTVRPVIATPAVVIP